MQPIRRNHEHRKQLFFYPTQTGTPRTNRCRDRGSGIGLETARRARSEGARVILTGRDAGRLQRAASEVEALSTAAFDAGDPASLERFFAGLSTSIDHVMVTAGGPRYGRLLDMDIEQARRGFDEHPLLMLEVARNAAHKVRPGGTLVFMGGTGGRRPGI